MIHVSQSPTKPMSGPLEIYTDSGEQLCTAQLVAQLAGCKIAALDVLVSCRQLAPPLGTVGSTRVWSRKVVDAWLDRRSHDRVGAELVGLVGAQLEGMVGAELEGLVGVDLGSHRVAELEDKVPAELRVLRRWTRHDHKRAIMTNGGPAWVMESPTWTTYAKAKASKTGDGLGFVLGDGIVAVDISRCITPEGVSVGASAILDLLAGTYAELSLSGRGVQVFCYADVAKSGRFGLHGVEIQVHPAGTFVTVTGDRLPGRPSVLAHHDDVVRGLLRDAG